MRARHIQVSPPEYRHAARIELERPAAHYAPGEPIRGRVIVSVGAADEVRSLKLQLQAHTRGRLRSIAVLDELTVYAGPWHPGASLSYPFQLTAPRRVPSYAGRLFRLEPRIAAVLAARSTPQVAAGQLGTEFDDQRAMAYPIAACGFSVEADARPLVLSLDPSHVVHAGSRQAASVGLGCGALFASASMAVGAAVLLLLDLQLSVVLPLMMVAAAGICAVLGVAVLARSLPSRIAERKIGTPHIAVEQFDQGAVTMIGVSVRVPAPIRVNSIAAALRVIERIEDTADTMQSEERFTLVENAVPLAPTSQPGVFFGTVPQSAFAAAPAPFALPAVQVLWVLSLYLDLPGLPDWSAEVVVDALPGGESVPIPPQPIFSYC